MRKVLLNCLWVAIAAGCCAAVATSRPDLTANIKIENFSFEPRSITIATGTTVTWTNADDVPHTAREKGENPTFDSGALDTDDKYSFTFTKPGTFNYYCKVHPHMTGTIVVKDSN